MAEAVPLLLLLCAVAWLCYLVSQRRAVGPTAFWLAAMGALFGAGGLNFLMGDVAGGLPVGHALSTLYPVLLLAGAVAYAGRRVPWWLIPAGAAVGGLRGLLALEGAPGTARLLSLAVEPAAALAAAALVFRTTRAGPATLAQRALAPVLAGVAVLEAATAAPLQPGVAVPVGLAGAWIVAAPLVLALQTAASGERTREALRRAGRELEERVAERTAALARSVVQLEQQIVEREAAERALRASEERYRAISELSSDYSFCFRIDAEGAIETEWVTDAVVSVTGYAASELQGLDWIKVIHPDDRADLSERLEGLISGTAQEAEVRVQAKSGETRWLALRLESRREPDGRRRVVGSAQNVTERKWAELERRRLEQHMQEAQRLESLGVLAGGIAHDFNNVLTVILGNTRLALSDLEAGLSPRDRLARIEAAADHAAALTGQMLTYSGKASVALHRLDLSELIREMLDLLRASVSRKCRLDVELAAGLAPIEGDATQMRQVLLNLVTNASDALGEGGGEVWVRTGALRADADMLLDAFGSAEPASGDYVLLEVADTGEGMDEARRARVFEPFFTTKDSGRGLGLAAVLGIVSAHRGAIKIASEPGSGTSFRVLIPAAAGVGDRRAESAAGGDAPAGARVLVIDDDPDVRELAREFLARAGFRVLAAGSGRAGIELLRRSGDAIEAVVLDLAMPGLAGREVLAELRRIRPGIPVVLASGFESAPVEDDSVAGFLHKPYESEALVACVRRALAGAD